MMGENNKVAPALKIEEKTAGAIQCVLPDDQANGKRHNGRQSAPTKAGGSRSSGGTLPSAASYRGIHQYLKAHVQFGQLSRSR